MSKNSIGIEILHDALRYVVVNKKNQVLALGQSLIPNLINENWQIDEPSLKIFFRDHIDKIPFKSSIVKIGLPAEYLIWGNIPLPQPVDADDLEAIKTWLVPYFLVSPPKAFVSHVEPYTIHDKNFLGIYCLRQKIRLLFQQICYDQHFQIHRLAIVTDHLFHLVRTFLPHLFSRNLILLYSVKCEHTLFIYYNQMIEAIQSFQTENENEIAHALKERVIHLNQRPSLFEGLVLMGQTLSPELEEGFRKEGFSNLYSFNIETTGSISEKIYEQLVNRQQEAAFLGPLALAWNFHD